jgi:hypothetical protein
MELKRGIFFKWKKTNFEAFVQVTRKKWIDHSSREVKEWSRRP